MNNIINTKICSKCRKEKNIKEFNKRNNNSISSLQSYCKTCKQLTAKQYAMENKEKIKEKKKQWRTNNPEKVKASSKKSGKKCYEKLKLENPDKLKQLQQHNKNWRFNNPDKVEKYKPVWKIYSNQRYKNNINFRLAHKCRMRIKMALKNNPKSAHTIELIGCSIMELKIHLEKQWLLGMNWDNYGKYGWVIDHIYPCNLFDLSDATEQKICFYYKNLQPLWHKDNSEKSSKLLSIYKNHQLT